MSETKSPDEEQVEPGFSEHDDFDFGETEAEPEIKVVQQSTPVNRKKVLFAIFGVVALVIVIMGYKIFRSRSVQTPVIAAEMPDNGTIANNMAAPPSPLALEKATKAPTSHRETQYKDIASAFSADEPQAGKQKTEKTAEATPTPSAPDSKEVKEDSIQDLHKTLFEAKTETKETPTADQLTELNTGLSKLNHQIDYILNQIKYLDSYTREVSDNLNRLNDSIGTMDSRLLALTNTTSTLSKDVGNVRSEVGHVKQVLKEDGLDINLGAITSKKTTASADNRIMLNEPEYVVHAVIPGRAWLKSGRGQIVTVAEGDRIGDYGKILVIDAANGIVLTSSGIAFR